MILRIQRVYPILLLLAIGAGCASLPPIVSHAPQDPDRYGRELSRLFPGEPRQFVHSVELTLPGGHSAMLMGVVNLQPQTRAIHCVIMTLEGIVLFDADNTGDNLVIHRAVPPFDSPALARGLVSDIELIFFRPQSPPAESGTLGDQSRVLRFSDADGGTTDIVISQDRHLWTLNLRNKSHRLKRCIRYMFKPPPEDASSSVFPGSITLTASFPSRYTLTMTLVESHLISQPKPTGDNE